MHPLTAAMVFILVWWMVFFCMLPLNIQSILKPSDGSMPGAPVNPDMKRKAILATIISMIIWLVIYLLIRSNIISFREIADHMSM